MLDALRTSISMMITTTLLMGFLYPAIVAAIAGALFPSRAEGSLIEQGGRVVGSELIGQLAVSDRYFWPRPSAAAKGAYDPRLSSGSNVAPSNPALFEVVAQRAAALRASGHASEVIPVDLVTASGSGLDPDLSPQAAHFQVARVSRARGVPEAEVAELVDALIQGRTLGILGAPRVNVLRLNLALDQRFEEARVVR
ncbi:MAG: potassium-transporting ATPase subunit KdpC [Acidobacteria bacterium]|nr:potassium-transporting ATPase subunit KdpC [Acidobacteriota bacterium]